MEMQNAIFSAVPPLPGERNYETNQRKYALLKKERIHIISNTSTTLFDKLSTQTP